MVSLPEVLKACEEFWPVEGAESWDAVGLVSGNLTDQVERVLLAVDAVSDTVEQSCDGGYDLLLTHHPLLLKPVFSLAEDRYKGALLSQLIRSNCALFTAHTNADVVQDGTSALLAKALGVVNIKPIVASVKENIGLGRVGVLSQPMRLQDLAQHVAQMIPATASGVRVAGDPHQIVSSVALCAGAGDSFLGHPEIVASDVYITSDLRHHPASESREQSKCTSGPALIDISHWASEWLWLNQAAGQLQSRFPGIVVHVSGLRTDPWDFVILQ